MRTVNLILSCLFVVKLAEDSQRLMVKWKADCANVSAVNMAVPQVVFSVFYCVDGIHWDIHCKACWVQIVRLLICFIVQYKKA